MRLLGAVGLACVLGATLATLKGQASVVPSPGAGAFTRGVALGLFATDPEWDYAPMVREIRARGATDVLVVVNAYQSDRFASDIALVQGRSPSQATVARTLEQVKRAGMRAALMPVVRLQMREPHEWRGTIAPADGLDAWFTSYRHFVTPLASIAERAGAHRFVVGSELSSLEGYDEHWRALIGELRTRFSGTLTYSANWDHAHAVGFWGSLDEVGLTAYFPLVTGHGEPPSSGVLARAWKEPSRQIAALARGVGKPVLITEVGYASQQGAAETPWNDASPTQVDLALQQRLYGAFCDAFAEARITSGFYVWNWFGFGGPRDTGFTPRGKPAAAELARCFARPWPLPVLSGNPS